MSKEASNYNSDEHDKELEEASGGFSVGSIGAIKNIRSINEAGEATRALNIETKTFEGVKDASIAAKSGGVSKAGIAKATGGIAGASFIIDKATDSTSESVKDHLTDA